MISIGTEKTIITKKIDQETAGWMRVPYMKGDFQSQFTYGYSLVGEIVEAPASLLGRYVHLLHPHQDFAMVSESDIFLIPDGIPPINATLASNMETAVNAVWDAKIEIGDKILIIGYGVIGALISMLLRPMPGINLTVFENNPSRVSKANSDGYEVINDKKDIKAFYDVAFNTSTSESGLRLAMQKTVFEGKIIELSWYGSENISVGLGNSFHYGRKKIISSQVSHIPSDKQYRWNFEKRKNLVFDILKGSDVSHLITRQINFTDAPVFYDQLRKQQIKDFSVIINY